MPTPLPPLQLQSLSQFFEALYGTYPQLFIESERQFYAAITARLRLCVENSTVENYLDIQRLIFKNIESKKMQHWYAIYHSVYLQTLRTSLFAEQLFSALLMECQMVMGVSQADHILVPGCGKFFELASLCRLFKPKAVTACDVDHHDLEVSRACHRDNPVVSWRQQDLTQPWQEASPVSLVLFMHPQVCDYDRLWESPTYKRYGNEYAVPLAELVRSSTHKFIPPAWIAILTNSLEVLTPGGHAIFMCYEQREMALIQAYLANKPQYAVLMADANSVIVDPAFSGDLLERLGTEQEASAQFVAMGAYRCVMVIQKRNLITES